MFNPWKPWYLHRPSQLLRRGLQLVTTSPTKAVVTLPWGTEVGVNTSEVIGRSIWTTGLYELPVTELLFRLVRPGDFTVDAGANIGYVTGVLAVLAGQSGEAHAFEPHPRIALQLRENVGRVTSQHDVASVTVHELGLSSQMGTASLNCGSAFDTNHGTASISSTAAANSQHHTIQTQTLDNLFGQNNIALLKLDVEGHEVEVLRGATELLTRQAIRHIVFESHEGFNSDSVRILKAHGYAVTEIGWTMRGITLSDSPATRVTKSYEAPNFLATTSLEEVQSLLRHPIGWLCLRNRKPSPGPRLHKVAHS